MQEAAILVVPQVEVQGLQGLQGLLTREERDAARRARHEASLDEIARGEFDLDRLREREAACAASEDLREGQAALAQKRPPAFRGR